METSDEVEEELEAVVSIVIDEIEIHRNPNDIEVQIQISPLTALNSEKCFVGFMLLLRLEKNYPEHPPLIKIKNPRGMSEEQVEELKAQMVSKCEDFQGSPVLFELLDLSREYLTRSNIPKAAPCSICLYTFEEQDIFCKTKCFHHFHSYCIGRYLKCLIEEFNKKAKEENDAGQYTHTSENKCEMLCPICRVDISDMDLENLLKAPEPLLSNDDTSDVVISSDMRKLQGKMCKLFIRQLNAGGIIDKEAEEKKYLIVTSGSEAAGPSTSNNSNRERTNNFDSAIKLPSSDKKEKLKIAARSQQPKYSPSNIHSESNKTEECIALKEGNDIKTNNAPNNIHMIDSSSHEDEIALTSKNSVDKRRSNNRGRRTKMNKYKHRTS